MSIDCEDGEPCVVHETRIRKAAKRHTCQACGRAINPGDFYANVFVVWDGNTDTIKRCGSCQRTFEHLSELCSKRRKETGDMLFPDDSLGCGLDYAEEWGGDPPPEIAALPLLSDAEAGQLLAARRGVVDA